MGTISIATSVQNPGRIYRPLFCEACGDIRVHIIDFIEGERNERGVFAWVSRRCTGLEPLDDAKSRRLRLQKDCRFEKWAEVPLAQWKVIVRGQYY